MNAKQKKSILKDYLGFLPAWFDLRKKEILKDSINIEQWQINMNYLIYKHGKLNSSERNAFNNWSATLEDPFIACLDLETHATSALVNMADGDIPPILYTADRNWFLAAYPDVFDYFFPQTNYLAEDFDAEIRRVEERYEAVEADLERMAQYVATGKGNKAIYLVRMKNFYKNELNKKFFLCD